MLVDARGQALDLKRPPRRLVSLVPSTTETLFALGLDEEIVGHTRFCVHPSDKVSPARWIGGTKNPKLDRIARLRPDLIFANLEENRAEDIAVLDGIAPVWVAYPRSVPEAIVDIRLMGKLVRRPDEAARVAVAVEHELARTRAAASLYPPWRYAYLIWRRPWMAAGTETFISNMLKEAGGQNVFEGRYPELVLEELQSLSPDIIMLPSEPFPFVEAHRGEITAAGFEPSTVRMVDGEYLSWHGVRLVEGLPYLRRLAQQIGHAGGER